MSVAETPIWKHLFSESDNVTMTLQEILEALDQLTPAEMKAIKTHILERETVYGSEPESHDLERMAGLFQADVTDLSINARGYLRDIMQNKHDRSH